MTIFALFALAVVLGGAIRFARKSARGPEGTDVASLDPMECWVGFQVREVSGAGGAERSFDCRFSQGGEETRFLVEYAEATVPPGEIAAFTTGRLVRAPESNPGPLLRALAAAHGATMDGAAAEHRSELVLEIGWFGNRFQPGPGEGTIIAGAFTSDPPGDWSVMKLFLPAESAEEEQGEIFLALNPVEALGLFLPKDPDYWPQVQRALSSVL